MKRSKSSSFSSKGKFKPAELQPWRHTILAPGLPTPERNSPARPPPRALSLPSLSGWGGLTSSSCRASLCER